MPLPIRVYNSPFLQQLAEDSGRSALLLEEVMTSGY